MGTPHREENNSTSMSDSIVEMKKDDECMQAKGDPMVNSSVTSLLEDNSVVNSELNNNSVSDSSLLNESEHDEMSLPNNNLVDEGASVIGNNTEASVIGNNTEKSDDEKSDISESSEYTKRCDSILNRNSNMSVEVFSILSNDNLKNAAATTSVESKDEEGAGISVQHMPNTDLIHEEGISVQDMSNSDLIHDEDSLSFVNAPVSVEFTGDIAKKDNCESDVIEKHINTSENIDSKSLNENIKSSKGSFHECLSEVMTSNEEMHDSLIVSNRNDNITHLPTTEIPEKTPGLVEATMMEVEANSDSSIINNHLSNMIVDVSEKEEHIHEFTETMETSVPELVGEKDIVTEKGVRTGSDQHTEEISKSEDTEQDPQTISSFKQDLLSPTKNSDDENHTLKKCPKIKISFLKGSDPDSADSLKNWFVSESIDLDEPTNIDLTESSKTSHSESSGKSILPGLSTKATSNISQVVEECDFATLPSNDKHSLSTEASSDSLAHGNLECSPLESVMTHDKMVSSLLNDKIELDNLFSDVSKSPHNVASETSFSDLPNKETSSARLHENSLSDSTEMSQNNTVVDMEGSIIFIKKEPLTGDEEIKDLQPEQQKQTVENEPVSLAKPTGRRGRPRKSTNPMKILGEITSPVKEEIKTETLDTEVLLEGSKVSGRGRKSLREVKTPLKEKITISASPQSGGRKKKSIVGTASTPGSSGRRKNYNPELVCLPFQMGWMREHVIRATGKDDKRRPSDIYYFAPDGLKLRSMPEISNYLSKHLDIKLTLENFTFAKELIYRSPFERERCANSVCRKVPPIKIEKTPTKIKVTTLSPKKKFKNSNKSPSLQGSNNNEVTSLEKVSSSLDSKKNTAKHRRSSSAVVSKTVNKDNSLNDSVNTKGNSKQKPLDSFVSSENSHLRPSRKIIKKVPFDNSFENMFPKVPSKIGVKRNYSGRMKKNTESEPNNDSPVAKHSESGVLNVKTEREHSNSPPVSPSASNSIDLPVDNSSSTISSITMTDDLSLERTNIKSPTIKDKLKVKFTTLRKAAVLLHAPCNKYCNFAKIRIPTVKCCICLCLFHPECIPFRPTGLTKYACVPCVKTQIDTAVPTTPERHFPMNFNTELLYPDIDLKIRDCSEFNKTFNKFFSPVDPSFARLHVSESTSAHASGTQVHHQPILPRGATTAYRIVGQNSLNSLNTYLPQQQKFNSCPPIPFGVSNTNPRGFQVVPLQRTPAVNPNINYTNPSSLPLLQNFSNSYFAQNQIGSNTRFSNPVNFQDPFSHRPRYLFTNSAPNVQNPVVIQKLVRQPQDSNFSTDKYFIVSRTYPVLQSVSTSATTNNNSVLQSILQSDSVPSHNSELGSYSAENVVNATQSDDMPMEKPSKMMKFESSKPESSEIIISDVISVSDSVHEISNSGQECSNNNKRTNNSSENVRKPSKVAKCDLSVDLEDPACKDNVQKNSESEQFTSFWDISKFAQIYQCLNLIFEYLNVSDLLRVSMVCRSWNHLASQKLVWEHACFSGTSVKNWRKCCRALQKHGTKYINFRHIHNLDTTNEWEEFAKNLNKLNGVEELIFDKIPPFFINQIAEDLPQLRRLSCYSVTTVFTEPEVWFTPGKFELSTLRYLGRLEELRISSMGGLHLKRDHKSLMPYLPMLTSLVLTGFKFNSFMNLECLSQQKQLITLELGECLDIEPQLYGLLSKLTNLENLCLQSGGSTTDSKMPEALLKMKRLKTLELLNFQVSFHLSDVLSKMDSLLHFNVWPDNRKKAAEVNFNFFSSATSCLSLKSLIWGVLYDDDDDCNSMLELCIHTKNETRKVKEFFNLLVDSAPGVKVALKVLPRSMWPEFSSCRKFM